MITFRTGRRIDRPIDEVFGYMSEPRNLPQWNSAVQVVRRVSAGDSNDDVGATYLMERALATGTVDNELEIVAHKRPTEFALRTTSGPTPFRYRFRFTPDRGATHIRLDAAAELGGIASLVAPLTRRAVRRGVDDNLATLKRMHEA